jgi:hypothetical protein
MIELLLGVLGPAISMLERHQRDRMMIQFLAIREAIRDERNKPIMERDMESYSHNLIRLRELCFAYTTFVEKQSPPSRS